MFSLFTSENVEPSCWQLTKHLVDYRKRFQLLRFLANELKSGRGVQNDCEKRDGCKRNFHFSQIEVGNLAEALIMSTRLAWKVWRVPETFPAPSFYSEKWCDLSVETKYEKKVLVLTKVKDESIFQLLTIKLGGCTLKWRSHQGCSLKAWIWHKMNFYSNTLNSEVLFGERWCKVFPVSVRLLRNKTNRAEHLLHSANLPTLEIGGWRSEDWRTVSFHMFCFQNARL